MALAAICPPPSALADSGIVDFELCRRCRIARIMLTSADVAETQGRGRDFSRKMRRGKHFKTSISNPPVRAFGRGKRAADRVGGAGLRTAFASSRAARDFFERASLAVRKSLASSVAPRIFAAEPPPRQGTFRRGKNAPLSARCAQQTE